MLFRIIRLRVGNQVQSVGAEVLMRGLLIVLMSATLAATTGFAQSPAR